jgi:hypothetical protein
MIIRKGNVKLVVGRLEDGVAGLVALAAATGGYVAESNVNLGERQGRVARVVLKIPSERWSQAEEGLPSIGKMLRVTVSTEDVGEQYVDLAAQRDNAKRLEERFLRLLETRTGKLQEVLEVERELARVRGEIERMEGRLRYLGERVRTSTLHVELVEPAGLLASPIPERQPLRDALRDAWANAVGFTTGLIRMLGFVLPLGLLLGLLGALARHLSPKRRRTRRAPGQRSVRERIRAKVESRADAAPAPTAERAEPDPES